MQPIASLTLIALMEIQGGLSITPYFLWGVLNETLLERKVPKHCTKLIFHNNSTLAHAEISGINSSHVGNTFIDVQATFESAIGSDYPEDWDMAELTLENGTNTLIAEKLDPCIIVASFVFNSGHYNAYLENTTNRRMFRHRLADLLQFSTPIRNRHLILLRIAEEFNTCPKGPKYPTRLVPQWELNLFDFFHEARVIQGPFHEADEPYLRVSKETGKWRWICEDIIIRLELEETCRSNRTCLLENPSIGQWDPRGVHPSAQPCEGRFTPRQ